MESVAIVDYGMGNLRSVAKAVEHVSDSRTRVRLTSSPKDIENADRVIFPGQGAAGECMSALQQYELIPAVLEAARSKPFLGVCMGLQVLLTESEENNCTECLDFFSGQVRGFAEELEFKQTNNKIPHMGWNQVKQTRGHPLWANVPNLSRFYFVHSYYVNPVSVDVVVGVTEYGIDFASALSRDNLFAVQFHPEKSAGFGLQLLRNFVSWNGIC